MNIFDIHIRWKLHLRIYLYSFKNLIFVLHWPYTDLGDKLCTSYSFLNDNLRTSYTNQNDNLWTSYTNLGYNRHEDFEEKVKNEDKNEWLHHFHHVQWDPVVLFHHISVRAKSQLRDTITQTWFYRVCVILCNTQTWYLIFKQVFDTEQDWSRKCSAWKYLYCWYEHMSPGQMLPWQMSWWQL